MPVPVCFGIEAMKAGDGSNCSGICRARWQELQPDSKHRQPCSLTSSIILEPERSSKGGTWIP